MTNELDTFLESITHPDPLDDFLSSVPEAKAKPAEPKPQPFIFKYDANGCILISPQARARILLQQSLSEDTCCSFDEWKQVGYSVKSGSKSVFKDALGVPQFTIEQVKTPTRY